MTHLEIALKALEETVYCYKLAEEDEVTASCLQLALKPELHAFFAAQNFRMLDESVFSSSQGKVRDWLYHALMRMRFYYALEGKDIKELYRVLSKVIIHTSNDQNAMLTKGQTLFYNAFASEEPFIFKLIEQYEWLCPLFLLNILRLDILALLEK